jgi:hypothetical protein
MKVLVDDYGPDDGIEIIEAEEDEENLRSFFLTIKYDMEYGTINLMTEHLAALRDMCNELLKETPKC